MTLSELDQLKALGDPLRFRILEALADERTTKQVAEEIGEKPTKLYHHVDALERVGLIKMTRTRRNRGTLEKYYQVVAFAFRADSSLFPQAGGQDADPPVTGALGLDRSAAGPLVANLLQKVGTELSDLAACEEGPQ